MSAVGPGYSELRIGDAHAIVREGALAFVSRAVETHGSLYDYAARRPDARALKGRGTLYLIPGPGEGRWVVRRLLHGGLLAPLTGERFLRTGLPRPFNELDLSERLRERQIPTPRVTAAVVYNAGIVYRGEVARDEITGARDLGDLLFGSEAPELARLQALAAAGRLLRSLHEAGLIHPDLNLKNILIGADERSPRAYILDLEKCRIVASVSTSKRRRMLARFRRSARQLERRSGRAVAIAEWEAFSAAYEEADRGGS